MLRWRLITFAADEEEKAKQLGTLLARSGAPEAQTMVGDQLWTFRRDGERVRLRRTLQADDVLDALSRVQRGPLTDAQGRELGVVPWYLTGVPKRAAVRKTAKGKPVYCDPLADLRRKVLEALEMEYDSPELLELERGVSIAAEHRLFVGVTRAT